MPFVWRKRGFLLGLPLLLALSFWQVRIESDLNAFFTSATNPDVKLLSGLLQTGELSRRYLLFVEAIDAQDDAGSFTNSLTRQLAKLDGVEQVWPANRPPQDWIAAVAAYAPYHARMFSLNPEQDRQSLFDPQQLTGKAAGIKQALLSPQGGFVKSVAKQDPLLLSLQGFKAMQAQRNPANQSGNAGALILQSQPPALDSAAHQTLQNAIRSTFDDLNQASDNRFRLDMAGVPVVGVAAHAEINRDVTLVSTVSSLAVVTVFLLLFRSFAALHWLMLMQATTFLIGMLAVAICFGQVHSLTLALGAGLIGICVDYPIHVMVHGVKHRTPLQAAARILWPSLLLGGLTTVIGYLALGMSGFPGFQQIAVFALFSIATALSLSRWLLPALLSSQNLHVARLPGIAAWANFCARRRKILWAIFAVLTLAAIGLLPRLQWLDDMQRLAMNMDLLKQQDAAVRAHFSSIEPGRFVLVKADDLQTALQRSEAAERRLQTLQRQGIVDEYQGLFPWLCSDALQARNAETYDAAVDDAFRQAWHSALNQTGLAVDKLGNLPPAASQGPDPAQLLNSPLRQILSGRVLDSQQDEVVLAIWLGRHDPAALAAGLNDLDGVRYFSQKDQLDHLAEIYRDSSLALLAVGVLIMAMCMSLQQRTFGKVLLSLLPSLAATLFIFAAWALLGEPVSFLHVIGLLLAISLCVDYGIFFVENRAQDREVTYHAIAASALTTLASFGALSLGKTPTLPILALSVSLGVGIGFLLCPLLIAKPNPQ